jgi:hypothetical protein
MIVLHKGDVRGLRAFNPTGLYQWISYALIISGWILATTITAGITRNLNRQ